MMMALGLKMLYNLHDDNFGLARDALSLPIPMIAIWMVQSSGLQTDTTVSTSTIHDSVSYPTGD
jgi:hypothetical protein